MATHELLNFSLTTTRLQMRPTETKMSKTTTGRQQRMCNVWYVNRAATEGNRTVPVIVLSLEKARNCNYFLIPLGWGAVKVQKVTTITKNVVDERLEHYCPYNVCANLCAVGTNQHTHEWAIYGTNLCPQARGPDGSSVSPCQHTSVTTRAA